MLATSHNLVQRVPTPELRLQTKLERRRNSSLRVSAQRNPSVNSTSVSTEPKLSSQRYAKRSFTKLEEELLEKAWQAEPSPELHVPVELDEPNKPHLGSRWKEIQGSGDWEGLIDEHPMDPRLRHEIIRYGEFAQACYDAFELNTHSKYCGECKYNKSELLDKVGLPDRGYKVTRYLYATSDPEIPFFFHKPERQDARRRDSNWIGYVAVATCEKEIQRLGRRDIVVAWRGTATSLEWAENLKDFLQPAGMDQRHRTNGLVKECLEGVKVESGFLHLYTAKKKMERSAREQLLWEIHRLVGKYEGEQLSITVTGHSLGGALALLSAYDIAESGMDEPRLSVVSDSYAERGSQAGRMDPIFVKNGSLPRPHNEDDDPTNNIPITVFSFAAPRVGNDAFRDRCRALGLKVLRVVNVKDAVPKAPGVLFNENSKCFQFLRRVIDNLPWTYSHVGEVLEVCSDDSPYLQSTINLSAHHNLEAHLHLVDGYHGPGTEFKSVTGRDPALVNKAADFLRHEVGIPPCWWQEMHKGLVRDPVSGKWMQPHRDGDDSETDDE